MLIRQAHRLFNVRNSGCAGLFLLLCFCFGTFGSPLYGAERPCDSSHEDLSSRAKETLTYYLSIADFAASFIEIPTSNVAQNSTTTSSKYLAGRAPLYNEANMKIGTCSASFLCMQTQDGIYTDISNYLSTDSGLVISWLTPTTLINLELDSIINSMVTECLVTASTKVGVNPFYGQTFDLVVSSEGGRIYFKFTRTGTIF